MNKWIKFLYVADLWLLAILFPTWLIYVLIVAFLNIIE